MNESVPRLEGWYPDAETGGTKYWDGSRWTGDMRPRRRPFAPAARHSDVVWIVAGIGLPMSALGVMAYGENGNWTYLAVAFGTIIVVAIVGIYLMRGQGPSTSDVTSRLAKEAAEAKAKRRAADRAGFFMGVGRLFQPRSGTATTSNDAIGAAQIAAISNPETAKALQNLQNLLYTRAITDAEYQSAKDKLLGTQALNDSFAQLAKLAELHEAGILGDVEFAAAKAKALGL